MFLRTYLIIALLLMTIGWVVGVNPALIAVVVGGLGVVTLILIVAATGWEIWNYVFGGRTIRLLLMMRVSRFLRRKEAALAAAAQLAEFTGLTFDASDRDEPERLERLFLRLRDLNGRVPSAFGRLLPGLRVMQQMWEAKSPEGKDWSAWQHLTERLDIETRKTGRGPSHFTRMGRMTNERLGRVFWPKARAAVDAAVASGALLALRDGHREYPDPAEDPSMRERMLWDYVAKTLPMYDMDDPRDLDLLPLPVQLRMVALHAALFGPDKRYLVLRRIFFRHTAFLDEVRELRERFQRLKAERAEAEREVARQTSLVAEELERAARSSVLLVRDWPLDEAPAGESFLGGTPSLPEDIDWPVASETGLPLMFLAEISCADIPREDGLPELPASGRLLFFADSETADEDVDTEVSALVRFVAEQDVPAASREAPEEIGSLAKWPISPHPVRGYAVGADMTAETAQAAAKRLAASLADPLPERGKSARLRIFDTVEVEHPETGEAVATTAFRVAQLDEAFPYSGAVAKTIFTSALSLVTARLRTDDSHASRDKANCASHRVLVELLADLEDLLEAIAPIPDTAELDEDVQETLVEFIASTAQEDSGVAQSVFETCIRETLLAFARKGASDPKIRALFDPVVYDIWRDRLAPHPAHAKHLMFATANPSERGPGLPLLHLDSDAGPGMMFGECGGLVFWIDPEDLAQGRFDRVTARISGGHDQVG